MVLVVVVADTLAADSSLSHDIQALLKGQSLDFGEKDAGEVLKYLRGEVCPQSIFSSPELTSYLSPGSNLTVKDVEDILTYLTDKGCSPSNFSQLTSNPIDSLN